MWIRKQKLMLPNISKGLTPSNPHPLGRLLGMCQIYMFDLWKPYEYYTIPPLSGQDTIHYFPNTYLTIQNIPQMMLTTVLSILTLYNLTYGNWRSVGCKGN